MVTKTPVRQVKISPPDLPKSQTSASLPKMANVVIEVDLREFINDRMDVEDIEILCSDVEALLHRSGIQIRVDFENLGGAGVPKNILALRLVKYLNRQGALNYLAIALQKTYPALAASIPTLNGNEATSA
jgi:hypothetical protein